MVFAHLDYAECITKTKFINSVFQEVEVIVQEVQVNWKNDNGRC